MVGASAHLLAFGGKRKVVRMFEAARDGDVDALRALLADGADVNARDERDNTSALHWAAASGSLDCVRVLVEAGADVIGEGDDRDLHVIGWATCLDEAHAGWPRSWSSRGRGITSSPRSRSGSRTRCGRWRRAR